MKEKIEFDNKKNGDNSGGEEKWAREFEEEFSELSSVNPEKYEDLKKKYISEKLQNLESGNLAEEMTALNVRQEQKLGQKDSEIDDLWQEFEWLNSKHEDMISEYRKSLVESTTGLKRRENLYKEMEKNIESLLGVRDLKKKSDSEVLDTLTGVEREVYAEARLSVMLGDMSYLSLANESGHNEGDRLLAQVGKTVKNELPDASRHGGDEFTALVLLDKKGTDDKVRNLELEIKKLKRLPVLERHGLDPNMDIGTAHISEAYSAFTEIIEGMRSSAGGTAKLQKIDIMREFEDVWLEIADKRSFIKKGRERIKLLIKKRTDADQPGEYEEVAAFLRKGGYNISDNELDGLARSIAAGESEDKAVSDYIKEKEKKALLGVPPFRRVRAEAILRVAEPNFLK